MRRPPKAGPREIVFAAAAIGALVACGVIAVRDFDSFARGYHVSFLWWSNMSLGALGVALLLHFLGGRWATALLPLAEAAASLTPVFLVLFLAEALFLDSIFPWSIPEHVDHDPILARKAGYLNDTFHVVRGLGYFAVWIAALIALRRRARAFIASGAKPHTGALAMLLLLHVFAVTFAAIDWGMSLEPHWYSTTYGFLFLTGQSLQAYALLLVVLLWRQGRWASRVGGGEQSLIDLGNFLLMFLLLWAYISFTQYLIIWSGNLSSDNSWYYHRSRNGWQLMVHATMVGLFALPFLALLSRALKRTPRMLAVVAGLVVVMRLVDFIWQIIPSFHPDRLHVDLATVVLFVAMGLFWCVGFRLLARRRLRSYAAMLPREVVS